MLANKPPRMLRLYYGYSTNRSACDYDENIAFGNKRSLIQTGWDINVSG